MHKTFQPYDIKFIARSNLNLKDGFQSIVIDKTIVSTIVLPRFCATNAHAPKPLYAIVMPIIAETTVPPSVEKKNFLNIMFLEIYAR